MPPWPMLRGKTSAQSNRFFKEAKVEPKTGIEPVTSSLPRKCSTN